MISRRVLWLLAGLLFFGRPHAALHAQATPWRFVVFGDSLDLASEPGINTAILGELASAIALERPDFVLFCGDTTYIPSFTSLSLWTNIMAPVYAAGSSVFPLVGNHEAADVTVFTNFFGPSLPGNGPPGETYSTYFIGHSNALILVLNEFVAGNENRVNQAWVDAVLATNTLPHVFAAGHMPAFKLAHEDCLGSFPTERDRFWNSLSNAQARLYFCGHDHFYDHCRVDDGDGNPANDLHQITVGTGGAPLREDGAYDGTNGIWLPRRVYHEMQFGYLTVDVAGSSVKTLWHDRLGPNAYAPTSESFTYSVVPPPRLDWTCVGPRLLLLWSGPASLESAGEPDGPFTPVVGAVSPYPLDPLNQRQRFFRLALP